MSNPLMTPETRDRILHKAFGARRHLEGCPSELGAAGALEAYDQTVVTPGAELRRLSLAPGDNVAIVRCITCGGMRYFAGTVNELFARGAA